MRSNQDVCFGSLTHPNKKKDEEGRFDQPGGNRPRNESNTKNRQQPLEKSITARTWIQESLKRHFPANQTDYGLCKQININFIYSFSLHLSIHCERISKYMVPCRTWYAYDSGVWRSGSAEAIELTRQRAQTQSAGPVLAQQTPQHSNILGRPGHDLRWG